MPLDHHLAILLDEAATTMSESVAVQQAVRHFVQSVAAAGAESTCYFLQLPDEILQRTLSFLDAIELSHTLGTCRAIRDQHVPAAAAEQLRLHGIAGPDEPLERLLRHFCLAEAERGAKELASRLSRPLMMNGEPFSAFTRAACPGVPHAIPGPYVFVAEFRLAVPGGWGTEALVMSTASRTPRIRLSAAQARRLRDASHEGPWQEGLTTFGGYEYLEGVSVYVWSAATRTTVQLYAGEYCDNEGFPSLPLCGRRARFMPRPPQLCGADMHRLGVISSEEEVRLALELELDLCADGGGGGPSHAHVHAGAGAGAPGGGEAAAAPGATLRLLRNTSAAELDVWDQTATPLGDDAMAELLRHVDFKDPMPPVLLSYDYSDRSSSISTDDQ